MHFSQQKEQQLNMQITAWRLQNKTNRYEYLGGVLTEPRKCDPEIRRHNWESQSAFQNLSKA